MMCIVVCAAAEVQFTVNAIVEEWSIMNPNLSDWRGERGTVFVQRSDCLGMKAEETWTSYQRPI